MKTVPTISIDEWLEAEARTIAAKVHPRPKGSITVKEFMQLASPPRSETRARAALNALVAAGEATKERWQSGNVGVSIVYVLKKK